ncbi:MAG: hypothetical protein A2Z88_10855 [Omnitrophica WOR_2 bacterium GWA2_47_8]|nr:MAG: hypothetical protein A2Z88_10855 [Omnitrophica WOR_2 bacterium GWA2_47_8]
MPIRSFVNVSLLCALTMLFFLSPVKTDVAQAIVAPPDPNIVLFLQGISDATENFAALTNGQYPSSFVQLTATNPAIVRVNYCGQIVKNHAITCINAVSGYQYQATPILGGQTVTVSTGGIFSPVLDQLANNIALGRLNLKYLAAASEQYKLAYQAYPPNVNTLVQLNFIGYNPCGTILNGFFMTCENTASSYKYTAKPYDPLLYGNKTYEISTGYILLP